MKHFTQDLETIKEVETKFEDDSDTSFESDSIPNYSHKSMPPSAVLPSSYLMSLPKICIFIYFLVKVCSSRSWHQFLSSLINSLSNFFSSSTFSSFTSIKPVLIPALSTLLYLLGKISKISSIKPS